MPYKDPEKPKIKCRNLSMIEERWDMFDKAKVKAEMEYGFMSNGGFLEYLLILNDQVEDYEHRLKRSIIKKHK